jgi:hypothetical protein
MEQISTFFKKFSNSKLEKTKIVEGIRQDPEMIELFPHDGDYTFDKKYLS